MSDRIPFRVQPMLATLVREPFHRPGWIYEEKYDGYRILAYKEGARVTLLSRNGKDRTHSFATIAAAVAKLPSPALLLDGEVAVFDRTRVSRFQLLQNQTTEPRYAVFDCLFRNGRDLRKKPLADRRAALESVIGAKSERIFVSSLLAKDGLKAFHTAQRKGFEGLIAKDAAAPYVEGRSNKWLKIKVHQEDEFVIVGYTAPDGAREHFGSLLLAAYDDGKLCYAGRVGTGFTRESLRSLLGTFKPLIRSTPPVADQPHSKDITFLAPKLVAQIAYSELTKARKLRQPVFLGLRDDKNPRDVTFPEAT
jgi:bifunctional non-homologous end joining protein LigD